MDAVFSTKDVYGEVKLLEEAMRRDSAPFYSRRTKEALVSFPDPETGEERSLFLKRDVSTVVFDLDGEEIDFYDELARYIVASALMAAGDWLGRPADHGQVAVYPSHGV